MEFLKKHPLFATSILICALGFLIGLVLTVLSSFDLSEANKNLQKTEKKFQKIMEGNPSYTSENVLSSDLNVLALSEKLESMRSELEKGEEAQASIDGVRVTAGIQQYISKFKRLAESNEGINGTSAIEIPDGFAFGFDRFSLETKVPESPEEILLLDKQRDILDFLMTELFATNPKGIIEVKRESAKSISQEEDGYSSDPSIFKISSSVTSRVEGAINTIPFQISFSGKTNSLREYLNRLADFDRPIVVRSINVSRPNESVKTKIKEKQSDKITAIFGEKVKDINKDQRKDPVVTENVSEFTLTLEYIEIVLEEGDSLGKN